jgi:hypothetical protein
MSRCRFEMRRRIRGMHLCVIALTCASCAPGRDLGSRVDADRVLALRPGMTYTDVSDLLGKPISMEGEMPPHLEDGITVVHRMQPTENPNGPHVLLTYSRPVRWAMTYPMIWVTLEAGKVTEIYVKRYYAWGFDSDGIYGYSDGQNAWGNVDFVRQILGGAKDTSK